VNLDETVQAILAVIRDIIADPSIDFATDEQIAEALGMKVDEVRGWLIQMDENNLIYVRYAPLVVGSLQATLETLGRAALANPDFLKASEPLQPLTINVTNSAVGNINTGKQTIDSAAATLKGAGYTDVAAAFEKLSVAIKDSQEVASKERESMQQHLSALAEEAAKPLQERRLYLAQTVLNTFLALLKAAPALMTVWKTFGPTITQALGM